MESIQDIPDELEEVLNELKPLEPLFHAGVANPTAKEYEHLMSPDFFEVGASGRRYSRGYVLSVLAQRETVCEVQTWEARDFHIVEAGKDNFLLTYTLFQPHRITRRLTVWRRSRQGWQAVYHQGTLVDSALPSIE